MSRICQQVEPRGAGRPEPVIKRTNQGTRKADRVISELSRQARTEHTEHQDRTMYQSGYKEAQL